MARDTPSIGLRLPREIPGFRLGILVRSGLPAAIRLGGAALQLLATVLIARALGPVEAGVFFFWSAVLMTLGQVSTFGLDRLALREIPRFASGSPERARFLATARLTALCLAAVLSLPVVAYAFLTRAPAPPPPWWYLLPPVCMAGVALCMVNGESMTGSRRPILGVLYRHTSAAVIFLAAVVVGLPALTANAALALYTFAFAAAGWGALAAAGHRGRAPHFAIPTRDELVGLLRRGLPICLTSIFAAVAYLAPLAILERHSGSADVAYLTTAFRLFLLFEILATAIHSLAMPDLSLATSGGGARRAWRVYRSSVLRGLVILGPPTLVMIVFPSSVMAIFGDAFAPSSPILSLLMAFSLASLVLGPSTHLLLMVGKTSAMASFAFARMACVCALSLVVIPAQGPAGMAAVLGVGILVEKACSLFAALGRSAEAPR